MSIRRAALELASRSTSFRRRLIASILKEAVDFPSESAAKRYVEGLKNGPRPGTKITVKGKPFSGGGGAGKPRRMDPSAFQDAKTIPSLWGKTLGRKLQGLKPGSDDSKYHEFARHLGVAQRHLERIKKQAPPKRMSPEKQEEYENEIKKSEQSIKEIESQIGKMDPRVQQKLQPFLKNRHRLRRK